MYYFTEDEETEKQIQAIHEVGQRLRSDKEYARQFFIDAGIFLKDKKKKKKAKKKK